MSDNNEQVNEFIEMGSSGLKRSSGNIHEEFLKELQGSRGVEVYIEMRDNSPIIGSILFAIENLIRQVEWSVEAVSDQPNDIKAAEFIEEAMHDMSNTWSDTISEILSFLPFGWSYHEIIYKRRLGSDQEDGKYFSKYTDGRIGWRKIPIRAQETLQKWEFDDNGGIQGMHQLAPPKFRKVFIPIEKGLLFRTKVHKNNPEGRSILRNAYRPYYFQKNIENIWGIGVERDLAGLPVALVPPQILSSTATAKEKSILEAMKDVIRNVRRDEQEGVIFPLAYDENGKPLYEFKLLNSGGSRQFDIDKAVSRFSAQQAMTVLADFILLGHEKVGSFSLASSKTDLFITALGAWLDSIADTFNRFAVPRLLKLNGFNISDTPRITHSDIETQDLGILGDFLTKMTNSGMELFPDDDLENWVRRQAGMPQKPDSNEELNIPLVNPSDENDPIPGMEDFERQLNNIPNSSREQISRLALNGAQVNAMVTIIQEVAAGTLPRSTGVKILATAFPLTTEEADDIMGEAGRSFINDKNPQSE